MWAESEPPPQESLVTPQPRLLYSFQKGSEDSENLGNLADVGFGVEACVSGEVVLGRSTPHSSPLPPPPIPSPSEPLSLDSEVMAVSLWY